MKKASIITMVLVLTATMFAGCRNMGGNPGNTTAPMGSSTRPTLSPNPQLPLPTGDLTTNPGGATNPSDNTATPGATTDPGAPGIAGRALRPAARGPRY